MSERNPGTGGLRPDHGEPPPWPEGPEASVFDRPAPRAHVPAPSPEPPDPSTMRTEQWPSALYPDQHGYPPAGQHPYAPPSQHGYPPAGQRAYAPPDQGRYDAPGHAPAPAHQRPPGDGAAPRGRGRGRRPDAAPGGGRSDEPSRSRGGGGLPFGLGFLVGVVGVACFLAGLVVLPWFVVTDPIGGSEQEVRLADIRSSFSVAETDPDDLLPGEAPAATEPGGTDADGTTLPGGLPTPGDVTDAAEGQVRDAAATAAASALDEGKTRYLELYTGTLWMVVAGAAVLAVVFSTVLSPRSFALSLLLGFRRLAGAVTVLGAVAHGAALWVVFSGEGAPSPAWGVWLGVGGLAGVLVSSIIGPKG